MTYPNDPESSRHDSYGNVNDPAGKPDPLHQEGYLAGQKAENDRLFLEEQRARDNDNAARGVLIGIVVASLLGLGVLAWYLLAQRNQEPIQQIIVPEQTSPSPAASEAPPPPPEVNITVPSTQPSQAPVSPPDVDNNITVPSPQPSQAPETAPEINNNITIPSPESEAPSPTSSPEDSTTNSAPGSSTDTAPTSPSSPPEPDQ